MAVLFKDGCTAKLDIHYCFAATPPDPGEAVVEIVQQQLRHHWVLVQVEQMRAPLLSNTQCTYQDGTKRKQDS